MAAPTVVAWVCLVMVLAAADDASLTQPPSLPLFRHRQALRSGEPLYKLLETLRPKTPHNAIQEQGLATSGEPRERFNEEGVQELIAPTQHLSRPASPGFAKRTVVSNQKLWNPFEQERRYAAAPNRRSDPREGVHSRQKRYTLKHKLRSVAVPLSVFNFLGFLPVRVPGLPYHNDLPSPDYTHYDTKYDVFVPRYRRRKTFRRL